MRHDDPLAKNLLARLFSYTPREGREPLEDSWFAEFLTNRGLKPMKIKTQKIQDYIEVFQLRQDMENFLKGLKLATGQIKFISDKADLWLGAYLNDNRFWLGFQLHKSSKTIYVYAECFLTGEKQRIFEKLKTNAIWGSQLYPAEELDGGCFDPESQRT